MADEGVIGERLNHLFATVHPAGRGPYTLREAADAINAEAGASIISPAYLSQLRTGQRAEPSHSRLLAIARFFGVDASYFNEDGAAEETDRQLEFLTAMRDAGVRSVALRAQGLSEASLAAVRAVIENARRLEGLRDGEDEPARLDRARSRCLPCRSGRGRSPPGRLQAGGKLVAAHAVGRDGTVCCGDIVCVPPGHSLRRGADTCSITPSASGALSACAGLTSRARSALTHSPRPSPSTGGAR